MSVHGNHVFLFSCGIEILHLSILRFNYHKVKVEYKGLSVLMVLRRRRSEGARSAAPVLMRRGSEGARNSASVSLSRSASCFWVYLNSRKIRNTCISIPVPRKYTLTREGKEETII